MSTDNRPEWCIACGERRPVHVFPAPVGHVLERVGLCEPCANIASSALRDARERAPGLEELRAHDLSRARALARASGYPFAGDAGGPRTIACTSDPDCVRLMLEDDDAHVEFTITRAKWNETLEHMARSITGTGPREPSS